MSELIHAYTNLDPAYPGYINFYRESDGRVTVTLRGNPVKREGVYVCGYAADKGKPGRCTPGDDHCNNYCNMAPQKGPMRDGPAECSYVACGETVTLTLSAEAYDEVVAGLFGPIGG